VPEGQFLAQLIRHPEIIPAARGSAQEGWIAWRRSEWPEGFTASPFRFVAAPHASSTRDSARSMPSVASDARISASPWPLQERAGGRKSLMVAKGERKQTLPAWTGNRERL